MKIIILPNLVLLFWSSMTCIFTFSCSIVLNLNLLPFYLFSGYHRCLWLSVYLRCLSRGHSANRSIRRKPSEWIRPSKIKESFKFQPHGNHFDARWVFFIEVFFLNRYFLTHNHSSFFQSTFSSDTVCLLFRLSPEQENVVEDFGHQGAQRLALGQLGLTVVVLKQTKQYL